MQDTIYARAKRGDLPSALSIPDICRLSTASLDCPLGRYSHGDDLALRRLVALGEIVPERSEAVSTPGTPLASIGGSPITTSISTYMDHYLTAEGLFPLLAELGEIGPLLLAWITASAGAAAAEAEPTATTKAKRGQGSWHRARVCDFCETILRAEPIDPDRPDFTAMDIAQAMKQLGLWHRPDDDLPDDETLRRYVAKPDAAGWFFYFPEGNPATHDLPAELRVERLVRAYQTAQKPDNETGSIRLPVSNFRATGRR